MARVLFMMPNWASPSEVWMQRMLEEIGDHLDTVASWDTGGAVTWRNRVRAVALQRSPSMLRGAIQRCGIGRYSDSPEAIVRTILRRRGITHVLCHYGEFASAFLAVWRERVAPVFVHFHGYDATTDLRRVEEPSVPRFPARYREDLLELASLATLIVNSEFTRGLLLAAGVPAERIRVKYLGVPLPPAGRTHAHRDEVCVLHVGRLIDFKSPDRTIAAFEMARARGMNGRLIVVGDGPLRVTCELLRARSPFRDSIEMRGALGADDVQALLAAADIFTVHNLRGELSSQSECLGVSVLEAMAAGLPVVGTRSGGVMETVVDGKTGVLVDPGDVAAQAAAIVRLAEAPALRQRYGAAGRRRVAERFSMAAEAQRLQDIMGLGSHRSPV